ncbi:MAG: hypothetical protein DRP47_05715 [Candidatus Zixiibacteriota bacterium]|nr:MAG: hypothetical protein DRP47_05715 [candidate division Zixibacteria bacterium]
MRKQLSNNSGFTLIEVVLVVVIMGILASVALRSVSTLTGAAKTEETKQELMALSYAIAGNPDLESNGTRTDFGYVGDVGSLPPNLDALYANPGSYATWNGPYVGNQFTQLSDDYKNDAWGTAYSYSGGVTIISTGSGSNIECQLAGAADHLLRNTVSGNVYDLDGTPPGSVYADSVLIRLTIPNGSGSTTAKTSNTDIGGYFNFDSIPIGNHDIEVIYLPDNDTLRRFVSVVPNSSLYSEFHLVNNVWYDTSGGGGGSLVHVVGSDSLVADCKGFYFYIQNSTGGSIDISSLTLTYSSPNGYYRYIKWGGTTVFNENNPKAGSGDVSSFTAQQTIADGASVRIDVDAFKTNPTGGSNVDVDNTTFTVLLSDGTSFDVTTGACP